MNGAEESTADSSAAAALAGIAEHGQELVRAEVALAKAELAHELGRAAAGAAGVAFGTALLAAALIALAVTLIVKLDGGLEAFAALSVALALLGACLAYWGKRQLKPPTLKRTREAYRSTLLDLRS